MATKDHPADMLLSPQELALVDDQVVSMRDRIETPIITTVGLLNRKGLHSQIEGVMGGSPAQQAGIKHEAEIMMINGVEPRSRTESSAILFSLWNSAQKGTSIPCDVTYKDTSGEIHTVDLSQFPNVTPRFIGEKPVGVYGMLLHDDVDYDIFRLMHSLQQRHGFHNPAMVTSGVMRPFFEEAITKLHSDERVDGLTIRTAPNDYFGGNVVIAGLSTFADIAKMMDKTNDQGSPPDALFISASMISRGGYDLQGYHYRDLEVYLGIPVIPLKSKTGSI